MHRLRTRTRPRRGVSLALTATLLTFASTGAMPVLVAQAEPAPTSPDAPVLATTEASDQGSMSLESAAAKAGAIGRKVAMSLIALGFSIAAIMLVFRRDFKEAAGVFVVGLLAILLATPAGVNMLRDTVSSLFGSS